MSLDKVGSSGIKPLLKLLGKVIVPITTTAIIWIKMERVVTVLAVILLLILIAKNCGVPTEKLFGKIQKTRVVKLLKIIARISPFTRMNEEYFEETAEIGADIIKPVIKQGIKINNKIKEEITMSKFKAWKETSLIWLKHNKKANLGEILLVLLAFDMYFGWSKQYGFPPALYDYAAGTLFAFIMWILGGEGFTSNIINRVRENAIIARKEASSKTKEYKAKLAKVDAEAKLMMKKYGVDNVLPEAMKPDYAKLMQIAKEYQDKIDEILEEIKNNIE